MIRMLKTVAQLLSYPEQDWVAHLGELRATLTQVDPASAARLEPLWLFLGTRPLLELQETYVATFDHNADNALYLFHHLYGDAPERGTAMSDLVELYRREGLEPTSEELPDFLPRYVEFLSILNAPAFRSEQARAHKVTALLRERLTHGGSPYAAAFDALDMLLAPRPRFGLGWLRESWSRAVPGGRSLMP